MTYIILVAGKGSRLSPLTLKHPKSLYKLDEHTTVLKRMVTLLHQYDKNAEIIVVTGFMSEIIEKEIEGVTFIKNPFYNITNSIASLWFASEYLTRDNVTIINGDIVMSHSLTQNIICKNTNKPFVLVDSSIKVGGDYNVQINEDVILVMSKDLDNCYGEYAGVTKLDRESSHLLKNEIEKMVNDEMYDQWYENALVQLIFRKNFKLFYKDIANERWTEVDNVNDFLYAKKIHLKYKD